MARSWTKSQEAAMNLHGKSLLVSAAAGSGKTSVLTERIIRSLTDPEHPADLSRLLVVTFTRAAASELKSKIAKALTEALAQNPGNRHLSRQLFLLGSAQISTIDSFFQKAVRANFEQLSLPASFRIADESEILPIATDILNGLIEEYYQKYAPETSPNDLFSRIEDNRFANELDHLMSNRSDGKLNELLMELLKSFASDPAGESALKKCAEDLRANAEQEYFKTSYGKVISSYLRELFKGNQSFLKKTLAFLDTDPTLLEKCGGLANSDYAYCTAMLNALEEDCYSRVREVAFTFLPGRFPTVKEKPNEIIAYQEWRSKLKKEIEKVQEMLKTPAEEISVQMQKTATLSEMLYEFYCDFQSRLLAEKNTRGILEHDDIRAMLYQLLTEQDGSTSAFAKSLAQQYDSVYIDEYQDVDFLQDRIFEIIGGSNRFMVGDIKQSIYGFRGSEPSIFASYRRLMPLYTEPEATHADGVCVFMSNNFRCNEPVIRFANRVCSFLFSACEESVGYRPQDDLVFSKSIPDKPSVPVEFAVFEAPPRRTNASDAENTEERVHEEAIWVAAEISRLLREERLDSGARISPSDIAILVRNKAHGATYAEELKKLNIPVAASAAQNILYQPLMTDMVNLLYAIDNPYRDLPLSEFLLSPLGGFTLEEISEIRTCADEQVSLYDAMQCKSKDNDLIAQKATAMLDWLEEQRNSAAVQPADRFLRLLYLDEKLIPYAQEPALRFLYDRARIYQRSSWCGLYGFLSHLSQLLEEGKVSADGFCKAENAVTVMTVHHSKGLEFPVVFLCSCGASFNKEDARKTLLYHRNVGFAAKLYNKETGNTEDTALRTAVKQRVDEEQTEEHIRTLYVALTRARERMYVTGTLSSKWETVAATLSQITRGNRPAILGCNNTLLWILAALQEKDIAESDFPCNIHHVSYGDVIPGISLLQNTSDEDLTQREEDPVALYYAKVLRKQEDFLYPNNCLHAFPTKIAASKIRPAILDRITNEEDGDEALKTQIELMQSATPSFDSLLKSGTEPSATDIGTATHAFLEFCDFSRLISTDIKQEGAKLVQDGFLSKQTYELINQKQLRLFLKSDLMNMIRSAKEVRREQKFGIFLPMKSLTQKAELANALQEHQIFVQGSIDLLLFSEDERIVLIDYKTDHINEDERLDEARLKQRMQTAHGSQLSCYAEAVKRLFGRYPDELCIYSLPLGRTVLLQRENLLKN
ncbi:MAG: UvrD-helicase domain-containing protein [Clostridia bacterium]|nr:UvrD-helicase domain-containing protein [Clostridia bacterium]